MQNFRSVNELKVCIIVLYNKIPRHEEILQSMLMGDLDYAIFIDNSDKLEPISHLKDLFGATSVKNQIIYRKNHYNIGLSKALNMGLAEAKTLNATHVFILDQDAILSFNYFRELYNYFAYLTKDNENIHLIGPIVANTEKKLGKLFYFKHSFSQVESVINSGMIFKLDLLERIGKFNESLFLGAIDYEFSSRIRLNGGQIFRVNKIMIFQDFGETLIDGNFVIKFLILINRLYSLIFLGLCKTNQLRYFLPFYNNKQYNYNLRDSLLFFNRTKLSFIRMFTTEKIRLIIITFGKVIS